MWGVTKKTDSAANLEMFARVVVTRKLCPRDPLMIKSTHPFSVTPEEGKCKPLFTTNTKCLNYMHTLNVVFDIGEEVLLIKIQKKTKKNLVVVQLCAMLFRHVLRKSIQERSVVVQVASSRPKYPSTSSHS